MTTRFHRLLVQLLQPLADFLGGERRSRVVDGLGDLCPNLVQALSFHGFALLPDSQRLAENLAVRHISSSHIIRAMSAGERDAEFSAGRTILVLPIVS